MEKITSTTELKNAIQILEAKQFAQGLELRRHFSEALMRFNPISLLMDTINGVSKSPDIVEKLIMSGVGLLSGFITRKAVVGSSGNIFRKLIGSAMQFGAANLVTQNAETIKMIGQYLYNLFLSKMKNSKDE